MKMTARKSGSNMYSVAFAALLVIALQFFVGAPAKAFEVLVVGAAPPDNSAETVFRCNTGTGACEPHISGIPGIPSAMVAGHDGLLYVGLFLDGVVKIFNADGEEVDELPPLPGQLYSLGIDPKGRLYAAVGAAGGSKLGAIYRYNKKKKSWDEFVEEGQGGFAKPGGIAFGSGKKIYVASSGTNQIFRVSKKGVMEVLVEAGDPGRLNGPLGILIWGDWLLVANASSDQILKFDLKTGDYLGPFACNTDSLGGPCVDANGHGGPEPTLNRPIGLTLGPDNHVFVSARGIGGGDNVVFEYGPNGEIINVVNGVNDTGYLVNWAAPVAGCIAYNGAPPPAGTVAKVGKKEVALDEAGCFEIPALENADNISIRIGPR